MNEHAFSYTYSAPCNQEVLNIRKKYLPQPETKLEELKRLDRLVQNSGVVESLCAGIGGCLVFGVGLCFGLGVLGTATWAAFPLGLMGGIAMCLAYPVYKKRFNRAKSQYSSRILELAAALSGPNNSI